MQLAAPRSTEGVTDNQHGERAREKSGGGHKYKRGEKMKERCI